MGRKGKSGLGGGGVTDAQNSTVGKIVRRTRDLKNEQLRIINEDGEVVLEKRGTRGEVATTVGEKREYGEGSVVIHNHPDGGTFSTPDLNSFGYGARQIVVATPEGTYKLTNTKYGQYDAKSGWYDMREAMVAAGITREMSFTEIQKKAQADPKVRKSAKQLERISKQWVDARKAGRPQAELDRLFGEYNKLQDRHKVLMKDARRRVETQPYHDFYRKNASKYGFKYEFTKR